MIACCIIFTFYLEYMHGPYMVQTVVCSGVILWVREPVNYYGYGPL